MAGRPQWEKLVSDKTTPLSPNTLNATEVTASNFVLPYTGRWVLQISATTNGISDVADVPFFAI